MIGGGSHKLRFISRLRFELGVGTFTLARSRSSRCRCHRGSVVCRRFDPCSLTPLDDGSKSVKLGHLNLSDFTVLYYFVVLNICFITGEERFIDIARLKSRGSLLGLGDDDAQHAYSKSRSCCDHFQSGECWDEFRKGHNHRLLQSTTDCCSVW